MAAKEKEETFGQLLRRTREDNTGLSQEKFGEAVGLSRKTIQTIENAKGRPAIKNEVPVVTRMEKVCRVAPGTLSSKLGWRVLPREDAPPVDAALDAAEVTVASDTKGPKAIRDITLASIRAYRAAREERTG